MMDFTEALDYHCIQVSVELVQHAFLWYARHVQFEGDPEANPEHTVRII